VRFVVNDRFDLALLAEADGVHLGQEDLPPERLPAEARRRLAVGRSTHSLEQARQAAGAPVDYVAFGPLFGTASKESPYDARGVEALRAAVEAVAPRPLVAIGGIDARGARLAREAGARGVAVISAVAGADDPEAATRTLVEALAQAPEDARARPATAHDA
jgi:thiamine-phosphate pyrophosphorylase